METCCPVQPCRCSTRVRRIESTGSSFPTHSTHAKRKNSLQCRLATTEQVLLCVPFLAQRHVSLFTHRSLNARRVPQHGSNDVPRRNARRWPDSARSRMGSAARFGRSPRLKRAARSVKSRFIRHNAGSNNEPAHTQCKAEHHSGNGSRKFLGFTVGTPARWARLAFLRFLPPRQSIPSHTCLCFGAAVRMCPNRNTCGQSWGGGGQ